MKLALQSDGKLEFWGNIPQDFFLQIADSNIENSCNPTNDRIL